MLNNAVVIKDYRGFIRQGEYFVSSLDINKIKAELNSIGINVKEYFVDEVINGLDEIKESYIIYTSSQNPEYKKYIDDALYHLNKNNILIPKYEILLSHENKGFQELLKKDLGINSLKCIYLSVAEDVEKYKEEIEYPVILKTVDGSSSKGVYKVTSKNDLVNRLYSLSQKSMKDKFKYFVKKNILSKIIKDKYNDDYFKESYAIKRFVLQEYVNSDGEDWKILVVNNRYYALNRKAKKNDFRASGSGIRLFCDPPIEVLEFAKQVYDKLDVPFISLDICSDGNNVYLIEFQGTHFGMFTLNKSKFHFINIDGAWEKVNVEMDMSIEYGKSIASYIKGGE